MINESLRKRLKKIHARLTDVEQELANPEVTKNIKKCKHFLSKEQSCYQLWNGPEVWIA